MLRNSNVHARLPCQNEFVQLITTARMDSAQAATVFVATWALEAAVAAVQQLFRLETLQQTSPDNAAQSENRGLQPGHGVWDLLFRRICAATFQSSRRAAQIAAPLQGGTGNPPPPLVQLTATPWFALVTVAGAST